MAMVKAKRAKALLAPHYYPDREALLGADGRDVLAWLLATYPLLTRAEAVEQIIAAGG
jgi:hypothetical protein